MALSEHVPDLWRMAVLLAGAGILSGFLAGLFGIGGGAILVPILNATFLALGVADAHVAHLAVATSLAIIIPTALRSYSAHRNRGHGDAALLRRWRVFVPAGVVAASLFVGFVSGDVLRIVFIVVAIVIAARMLFLSDDWSLAASLPPRTVTDGVGFGIGAVSTFMGIGGGNLNNLFMTAFGQSIHQSVATSAGLGPLIAIPAVLGYVLNGIGVEGLPAYSLGYVNLPAAFIIAPFSVLVSPLGAALAHRLPSRQLRIAFAIFLLLVSARMLAGLFM